MDGPQRFAAALQPVMDRVDDQSRYPVTRTRYTEERHPLPDYRRHVILMRDGYKCQWCGDGGLLEVDHIVPWSAGGSDEDTNLRTLCRTCNQDRSNRHSPTDAAALRTSVSCVSCDETMRGDFEPRELSPAWCLTCRRTELSSPEGI